MNGEVVNRLITILERFGMKLTKIKLTSLIVGVVHIECLKIVNDFVYFGLLSLTVTSCGH